MVIVYLHSFTFYKTIIHHTAHIICNSLFNFTVHILNTLQTFVWSLRSFSTLSIILSFECTEIYISILLQKHKVVTSQTQCVNKHICCMLYASVHISLWIRVLNTFVWIPKIITDILYGVDRLNFERDSIVYQGCIIFVVGESMCCCTYLSAFGDVSISSYT